MTDTATEKRGAVRVQVNLIAHLQLGVRFLREPVSNLSLTGLFLKTRERAREGTTVRLALALPAADGPHYCTVHGNVARTERDGLGVSFAQEALSILDRDALQAFLEAAPAQL